MHASLPTELVLEDERHVSEQLDIAVPEKKLDGLASRLLPIKASGQATMDPWSMLNQPSRFRFEIFLAKRHPT